MVPFTETKGLYFDDNPEPQNREFIISEELDKKQEEEGVVVIHIGDGDAIKYYDAKYKLMKQCHDFAIKSAEEEGVLNIEVDLGDDDFMF